MLLSVREPSNLATAEPGDSGRIVSPPIITFVIVASEKRRLPLHGISAGVKRDGREAARL